MTSMSIGAFLRKCRKKAKLSQEDLAELLNRNQSDISKAENDSKGIDIITFRDWTRLTNHVEAGIAFLYGIDTASIIQQVMQVTGAA